MTAGRESSLAVPTTMSSAPTENDSPISTFVMRFSAIVRVVAGDESVQVLLFPLLFEYPRGHASHSFALYLSFSPR